MTATNMCSNFGSKWSSSPIDMNSLEDLISKILKIMFCLFSV